MAAAHMEPAALYTPVMAKQKGLRLQKINRKKNPIDHKNVFFYEYKNYIRRNEHNEQNVHWLNKAKQLVIKV